jgi:hypothetical protein
LGGGGGGEDTTLQVINAFSPLTGSIEQRNKKRNFLAWFFKS